MKKARRGLAVGLLVCGTAGMSSLGCNTIGGAGQDIQRGGEAVEDAAEGARTERIDRKAQHLTTLAFRSENQK